MMRLGTSLLAIGLACALSLAGYGLLRVTVGAYLDANLAVLWEALTHSPYRPLTGRSVLIGLAGSLVLSSIGWLMVKPERKRIIRRVAHTPDPPKPLFPEQPNLGHLTTPPVAGGDRLHPPT
jgi:hypothetical protein